MEKFTYLNYGDHLLIPEGTEVRVYTDSGGTTPATIYQDDGVTEITQPLLVDANGEFSFRANDGRYYIKVGLEPLGEQDLFDTSRYAWNGQDLTLDINTGVGVTLQCGQEFLLYGYNNSGSTISNGTAVSLVGSAGTNRPTIKNTDPWSFTDARCFVGTATMDIPNGESGFVTRSGLVRRLRTGDFSEGDRLWVGAGGALTATEPTSGVKLLAGMCLVSNNGDGVIYSNPRMFETTPDTLEPTGFPNRTDSAITFNNSNREFTIAPTGTRFHFWSGAKMFTKTTAQTVTITNTKGLWFIYFNTAGVLTASQTPWEIISANVPVATVYWTGTAGAMGEERHGLRDLRWHRNAHNTIGARYDQANGGGTGTFSTSALSVTQFRTWDEDIMNDSLATKTQCRVWYRGSDLNWLFDASFASIAAKVVAGALQYDDAGTLRAVTTSQYVVNDLYGTNDPDAPLYLVTGQAQHPNVTAARSAAQPTAPMSQELKLMYRLIWRNVGGTPTYVEVQDYRLASSLPGGGTLAVNAASVVVTPSLTMESSNVQAALEEIDQIIDSVSASGAVNLSWATHGNRIVYWTGTASDNITIPNDTTDAAWPVGGSCIIVNVDGTATDYYDLTEDSGLTVTYGTGASGGRKGAPGSWVTIYKRAANTWYAEGRLTA